MPHYGYRVGMPRAGAWRELLNRDSSLYGGSDVGNQGAVIAEGVAWHDQPFSAEITLPPLAHRLARPRGRAAGAAARLARLS